jgi:FAD/FMN-containing dehydrogenase/Fe-S oxidoreductase
MTMSALRAIIPTRPTVEPKQTLPEPSTIAELQRELEASVQGEVRFDAGSRAMYSVDSSNYRQVPIGVVVPRSIEDVINTVAASRKFHVPLLSRGGGTSLAGQCCNTAVVMDWSKYLGQILNIDPVRKQATVRPGCVLDSLRNAVGKYGLTFGPDPATHDHCTLGGMLGNNSCGMHAQMAGSVASNTEALEVLLYDGTRMNLGWTTDEEMQANAKQGGRVGEIYRSLLALRDKYQDEIRQRYPNIPRRISGYNLDQLIPDEHGRINLARAVVGSEGTLVTILSATLRLVHNPPFQTLVVLGYPDVYQAGDHIPEILESKPMGLEGIDYFLIENMKKKGLHVNDLSSLPDGKGWLMVQLPGDTLEEADGRARELMERLKSRPNPPTMKMYDNPEEEKHVWDVRESGLGATAFVPGLPASWPGWEDAAVAPDKVGPYLRDFCKLLEKHGYVAALYGHFGMGCIHCRITFDVVTPEGIRNYRSFAEEAADLVVSYGGSLSGEHGDGQSRAELLPKMFGEEIVQAFREYKSIWDPDWKMNPGKVVNPYRLDENLRLGADYRPWEPETHFKFPNDHGEFSHATLRCVGVGKCRRESSNVLDNQTMCPSYMVTHEEKHTTRGRAHLLWEMLHGDPIKKGWRDDNVKEALDLCLSCKGCKGDCPVNVDMATYKAEFLSHYWEGRLRPRSAYAFGLIDKWARASSLVPGLVNLATSTPGIRELAKLAVGMPMERSIPQFAPEPFTRWFRKNRSGARIEEGKTVLLFPDTFNNYFFPQTAQAAVEVLEHLGYQVVLPESYVCCGRPLYDYGFLDAAEKYLLNLMKVLRPALDAKVPIVVLEPSCWSVMRDEVNELFPDRPDTHHLMENTFLLAEFLEKHSDTDRLPKLRAKVMMHAHCHHKAIIKKAEHEENLLRKMGAELHELTSGCCGMAGSFGFEKDKYDVSVQVGEHNLLPAVRRVGLSTPIVADGFSCREQVAQLTNRHPLHFAELLKLAMKGDGLGFRTMPENEILAPHRAAVRRSKLRAGIAVGAIAAGAGLLSWAIRKRS